jgi:hypothetical protein
MTALKKRHHFYTAREKKAPLARVGPSNFSPLWAAFSTLPQRDILMIGIHQRCAGEKESGRKKNNAPQATLTSPAFDLRNNVSV